MRECARLSALIAEVVDKYPGKSFRQVASELPPNRRHGAVGVVRRVGDVVARNTPGRGAGMSNSDSSRREKTMTEPAKFLEEHRHELARYDKMARAIAECERFDEVKEIRNRALVIEIYAAQALNHDAEDKAAKIRMRAERRCGELLKESKKNGARQKPGDNRKTSTDATSKTTLADIGISRQQSSDWQKLAEIPKEQFEARLNDTSLPKPTTAELIRKPTPKQEPQISSDVLFVWGRICDFERHSCCDDLDPRATFNAMHASMQDDILRILPKLIPWLQAIPGKALDPAKAAPTQQQPYKLRQPTDRPQ